MSPNAVAALAAVGTFVVATIVAVVTILRAVFARMDQMEARLTQANQDLRTELRAEFRDANQGLRAEFRESIKELRTEVMGAFDKVWLVLDDVRDRLTRLEERVARLRPGSRDPTPNQTPPEQDAPEAPSAER